jgi:hypothetical protein
LHFVLRFGLETMAAFGQEDLGCGAPAVSDTASGGFVPDEAPGLFC